jgi:hypothetical protein
VAGRIENLKHFTSEYQPANKGRKPSKLRKYIKDNGMGAEDVALLAKNILFSYSEQQLRDLLTDKERPMIIRLLVRAYLEDFKNGTLINMDKIMDRAFGTPQQSVTVKTELTPEEREAKIKELMERLGYGKD